MSLRDVASIAAALLLAACAAAPPPKPGVDPSLVAARPLGGNGVALVLSGGSARGFAHVGVLKALDAAGLRPDLVVGCSAGAIIGSLYASGLSAAGVEAAVSRLDGWIFSQVAQPGVAFLTSSLGLVRSDGLEGFVDREAARQSIEEYPIPFAAVATDLHTGRPQVFNAGDGGKAVSASSAVPGLMTPVEIRGRRFTDCQVSSPLPVEVARTLGARRVIAVDVIYPPEDAVLTGTLRVLFQAFAIAAYRIKELETQDADLVITPELGSTSGQWSFKDRERLIAAGEATTRDMIPRLKLLFGK